MRHLSRSKQVLGLAGWLALSFFAAALGSLASLRAGSFYTDLERPAWAPPAAVFGPVWTLLYMLMGSAAWLVWQRCGWRGARTALRLFLAQLAVNALWTWLFFAWRLGAASFVDIVLLWLLLAATLVAFWRIRGLAGLFLLPYLLWVSYAGALNFAVWQLNPQVLG